MYLTRLQTPRAHQMTFDEFLLGNDDDLQKYYAEEAFVPSSTYTIKVDAANLYKYRPKVEFINELVFKFREFKGKYADLYSTDRAKLYRYFLIPKRSGGLRKISAPSERLDEALRELLKILKWSGALYHTSAFAYIPKRCPKLCVERHQRNDSNWYAKFDFKDFFGSSTLDYVVDMFGKVYPFFFMFETSGGRELFRDVIELAFLNGGLPQGSPASPFITNVMMIPFDFEFSKKIRESGNRMVNTRYCDDIQVSSKYEFDIKKIEESINGILSGLQAPMRLNQEKTRYGSRSGKNWNLGLMVNQNNDITVGYRKKKQLQSMLHNYIIDKGRGLMWDISDVQSLKGLMSYYRQIEGEVIDNIIKHVNKKHKVNVEKLINADLKPK